MPSIFLIHHCCQPLMPYHKYIYLFLYRINHIAITIQKPKTQSPGPIAQKARNNFARQCCHSLCNHKMYNEYRLSTSTASNPCRSAFACKHWENSNGLLSLKPHGNDMCTLVSPVTQIRLRYICIMWIYIEKRLVGMKIKLMEWKKGIFVFCFEWKLCVFPFNWLTSFTQ